MTAGGALGIIAGGGRLPVAIAGHARDAGLPYFVIRLSGLAEPELSSHPGEEHNIGALGAIIATARKFGADRLVLAGNVPRPDFASIRLDLRAARCLPRVLAAARNGDDALLRAVAAELESEGFRIVGADEAAGVLRAPAGALGAHAPDDEAQADIDKARRVVRALGEHDVGQGAVVCAGLVLAVEAAEGTDRMLERVAGLPPAIRGDAARRRGVLVKQPKPGQERRIDLPTVGVRTIEGAANAGLAGVAVEAGGALIVDRDAVVAAADAAGLFVFGFEPDTRA